MDIAHPNFLLEHLKKDLIKHQKCGEMEDMKSIQLIFLRNSNMAYYEKKKDFENIEPKS